MGVVLLHARVCQYALALGTESFRRAHHVRLVCGRCSLVRHDVFYERLGGSKDGRSRHPALPDRITRGLAVCFLALSTQRYRDRGETGLGLRTRTRRYGCVVAICVLETGTSTSKSPDDRQRSMTLDFTVAPL